MDIVLETCPAPECNLTPRDLNGLLDQLAAYHAHFVTAISHDEWRAEAFVTLEPLLPTGEQEACYTAAIAVATSAVEAWQRIHMLLSLLPHLPTAYHPAVCADVLTQIAQFGNRGDESFALARLADFLLHNQYGQALTVIAALPDTVNQVAALLAYLPGMAADQQQTQARRAFTATLVVADEQARWRGMHLLAQLLPYLAPDERRVACQAVLSFVAKQDPAPSLASLLIATIPYIPNDLEPLFTQAAHKVNELEPYVGLVLACLPFAHAAEQHQLSEQIVEVFRLADDSTRRHILTQHAAGLPEQSLLPVIEMAHTIGTPGERVTALTLLLPRLPSEEQAAVCADVLASARAISDPDTRMCVLAELGDYARTLLGIDLLDELLLALEQIKDLGHNDYVLTLLASFLETKSHSARDDLRVWCKVVRQLARASRATLVNGTATLLPFFARCTNVEECSALAALLDDVVPCWP